MFTAKLILLLVFPCLALPLRAQAPDAPSPSDAGKPPLSTQALVYARRDGLWFSTHDKSSFLRIHGYIQADDRLFLSTTHNEELDTFLFRRIRPLFEGTLFHAVDFRFMPDFGQNNPQVQEAFLELRSLPFLKVRVGKFKEPIGLEVLRSDRDLTFAERSLASDLVPLRYTGAQISGSMFSDAVSYAAGYFDGSSDGSNGEFTDWTASHETVARVFLHPFAKTGLGELKSLGIGLAGSAGNQAGIIAGLKTVGQTTFFKYSSGALADGQHNRLAPQAYYYGGPFGVMAEYVISSQDVLNRAARGRMRNEAWQIAGSFMLTGERGSYGTIRPRHSFDPGLGIRHLGAFELALRASQLQIDGAAFPAFANPSTAAREAKELGAGLNWYLNQYVKLTSDYEHTEFRMAAIATGSLHSENVLMSRLQLAF